MANRLSNLEGMSFMRKAILIVILTLMLIISGGGWNAVSRANGFSVAAAGGLDPTFGTGGRVFVSGAGASALAVQADGKLVVVGSGFAGSHIFEVIRLNTDGSLDMTFGAGGRVTTDFSGFVGDASDVVIQPDGKIVAGGTANAHFALARYNPDGSLDSSFGSGGKVVTPGTEFISALALQPDGKIVAAGGAQRAEGGRQFAVARYNADGSLDASFGSSGVVLTDRGATSGANGVALQTDGKVVVTGHGADFITIRYNTNGSLDSGFGSGGVVATSFTSSGAIEGASDVAIQPDGKIVAVGIAPGDDGIDQFALVRYDSSGNLDPTFGSGGKVTTDFSSSADTALAEALQTDGKIVVVGGDNHEFAIARYNPDGSLDAAFGSGGKVTVAFSSDPFAFSEAEDVAIQADGRIVIAGITQDMAGSHYALARLLAVPTPCALACPDNVAASNTPNQCGAVVNYPAPGASGDCHGVSCSPAAGSFFPVGTTTVTCTAASGETCSFRVKVEDTQPPTLACPANVTAVATPACPFASNVVVTFATPAASDNCAGVTVACTPPSGSRFPLGTTAAACTATDAADNTASCSFSVTVFDVFLRDDANPTTTLLFNSQTGDYRFACGGTTFTGRGGVTLRGCAATLQHNPADRRVLASIDQSTFRGSSSLQSPPGSTRCTISDRDTRDNR